MNEREQLEAWIQNSLRFRGKLKIVALIAAVAAIAVYVWSSTWGIVAMLIVGSVWGAGWWITFGHISDWRTRIARLDRR
ncbi:MAG TPA: hypothetical protein VL463_31310 [Kofleriaceae bacterium]|jgi:amino acid transporter|nr:hypothetical protein [Kofleriaceae bacterium]